jgi:hypothetical protein
MLTGYLSRRKALTFSEQGLLLLVGDCPIRQRVLCKKDFCWMALWGLNPQVLWSPKVSALANRFLYLKRIPRARFSHDAFFQQIGKSTWHYWQALRDLTHWGPPGSKRARVAAWQAVWISTHTQHDTVAGQPCWKSQQKQWREAANRSGFPRCG